MRFKVRMERRAAVVRAVRSFFDARGFIEVDTPVAISAPAPEPHIDAPNVTLHLDESGSTITHRFLQPSPELPMKRLLAAGLPLIYQIAPVFRQGDLGPWHRPEFRLLEWYRSNAGWESLLPDCEGLLRHCARQLHQHPSVTFRGQVVDLSKPFRRLTVDEAFVRYVHFSILERLDTESLRRELDRLGIHHIPTDAWNDLFHRIFLSRVEPALLQDPSPLFLTHYPAPLSALARLDPTDPRCCDRFELYVGGVELANAFGELTDPREQRTRFERDRAWRRRNGLSEYPLDERFLAALEHLPPSAGIALGLDRLLALFLDATSLDNVAFIPWSET